MEAVKGDVSRMAGRLCFVLLLAATSTAWAADVPAKWISGSSADPEKPAPAQSRAFRLDAMPERADGLTFWIDFKPEPGQECYLVKVFIGEVPVK